MGVVIKMEYKTIYEYFPEYSYLEINRALKRLPYKYQKVLSLKYHKIKNTICVNKLSLEDEKKFQEFLKYLEIKLEKRYQRKIKTIYEYFPNYKEEEIDMVISTLVERSRKVLYLKYGNNLKNPIQNFVLNQEDAEYFYTSVLESIRISLNNQDKFHKTIYDYFPEYSIEEIDPVIENLSERSKLLLKKKYGDNLKNPKIFYRLEGSDAAYFKSSLIVTMKRYLTKKRGLKYNKTIYEYIPEYQKEQIDIVLDFLPEEVIKVLKMKYVGDIKEPTTIKKLNKEEFQIFHNGLLTIKRNLERNKRKIKTIYDYFSNYSEETIDKTLKTLPEKAKLILILKYGLDFNNPINEPFLNYKQKRYFNCNVLPYIRKRLNEHEDNYPENVNYQEYKKLISLLKQFILSNLLINFTDEEVMIIILNLFFNYDKKVISIFLDIEEEKILEIIKRFLNIYKDKLLKEVNLEKVNSI